MSFTCSIVLCSVFSFLFRGKKIFLCCWRKQLFLRQKEVLVVLLLREPKGELLLRGMRKKWREHLLFLVGLLRLWWLSLLLGWCFERTCEKIDWFFFRSRTNHSHTVVKETVVLVTVFIQIVLCGRLQLASPGNPDSFVVQTLYGHPSILFVLIWDKFLRFQLSLNKSYQRQLVWLTKDWRRLETTETGVRLFCFPAEFLRKASFFQLIWNAYFWMVVIPVPSPVRVFDAATRSADANFATVSRNALNFCFRWAYT